MIDFSLRLLGGTDIDRHLLLDKFRILMTSFWTYTKAAILNTRQYREGVEFIQRLTEMNEHFKATKQITTEEYESYDSRIISFQLQLLDRLDWWPEYLELFERVRVDKPYYLVYYKRSDPEFDKYVLETSGETKFCHFLYLQAYRYELIKRKLAKMRAGESVGNLIHKSPGELSSEEVERRFTHVLWCAENGLPVFEPK